MNITEMACFVYKKHGMVAGIEQDIIMALEKGEQEFSKFSKERLESNKTDFFFHSMTKLQLKPFTTLSRTVNKKINGKEICITVTFWYSL